MGNGETTGVLRGTLGCPKGTKAGRVRSPCGLLEAGFLSRRTGPYPVGPGGVLSLPDLALPAPRAAGTEDPRVLCSRLLEFRTRVRCREHPPLHTHLSVPPRTCPPRHKLRYHVKKLKVPPRPFPLEEHSHCTTIADSCKSFSLSLSQTVTECGRVHTQVWKRIQTNEFAYWALNHTKIYRVNLVGFKHSAEDPSRSPHHQNKYTLRSKRFSNVLSKASRKVS